MPETGTDKIKKRYNYHKKADIVTDGVDSDIGFTDVKESVDTGVTFKFEGADKVELRSLRKKIKVANNDYFNKGGSKYSDGEYDAMVKRLKRLNPQDRLLSQIGDNPTHNKVTLPYSMPSLGKIHSDRPNAEKWMQNNTSAKVTVSDKLDGVSALYLKDAKGAFKLYTRGNGTVGSDISHLIPSVKGLGRLRKGEVVRGELIMTRKRYEQSYSSDSPNSRNLVSGYINSKRKSKVSGKHINFIVHEQLKPKRALAQVKSSLKSKGFYVVPHKTFSSPTLAELTVYMENRKSRSKVDLDGVVLQSGDSKVALKGPDESVVVTVKAVQWNVSQYGTLKPTVVFKNPPTLAGAKISKATGHNAKFIESNGIGPGAKVLLVRSGDVIPKITGVIKSVKPSFPKTKYSWKNATDIETKDTKDDVPKRTKVLIKFLVTIGVDKVKYKSLLPAVSGGVVSSIYDLLRVTENQLRDAGLGNAVSSQIVLGVRNRMKQIDHATLMKATGFFGEGLGDRKLKPIVKGLGIKRILHPSVTPNQLKSRAMKIKGIGTSNAESFAGGVLAYRRFVKRIKWKPSISKRKSGSLTGKSFAFSGFRDKEAEKTIVSLGGEITGITKSTSYLVTDSLISGKIRKARKYGITILSSKKFGTLLKKAKSK